MTLRLYLARRTRSVFAAAIGTAATFLAASVAHAQSFTFSLTPAQKSGMLGGTVVFQGILSNNTNSAIFITGLSHNFDLGVSGGYTPAVSTPFSIAANSSYTGDVFSVRIDSTTTPTNGGGTITVNGGATDTDITQLAEVHYNISLMVLPETNTLALIALALPIVGGVVVHRRRKLAL